MSDRSGSSWEFPLVYCQLREEFDFSPRNEPRLAPLAAPVHRRALLEARPIAEALGAGRSGTAVHVREGAPLFFFHPAGPEGPRYRLVPAHGGWAEVGGTGLHTEAELLDGPLDLLPRLRPGLSELFVHPDLDTDGGRRELKAVTSPRVRQCVARLGIELVPYARNGMGATS